MKLSGAAAARFPSAPDKALAGALIYGEDGAEVSARRDRLRDALLGGAAEADLLLTRLDAGEVRREPALILDAMKARGFFSGRQVVTLDNATDGLAGAIEAALGEAGREDAFLIVTAGALQKRSKLRAVFEAARNAAAAPVYSDAGGPEALRLMMDEQGLERAEDGAMALLQTYAAGMDSGTMRDFLRRLALYRFDEPGPLREADVRACAPDALSADIDSLLDNVLLGAAERLSPGLRRIETQGEGAVTVALAAQRRFADLHARTTGAGGRPLFGAAKDVMERALRRWGQAEAEAALRHLFETDLALRGPAGAAPFALLERALMRLALLPKAR